MGVVIYFHNVKYVQIYSISFISDNFIFRYCLYERVTLYKYRLCNRFLGVTISNVTLLFRLYCNLTLLCIILTFVKLAILLINVIEILVNVFIIIEEKYKRMRANTSASNHELKIWSKWYEWNDDITERDSFSYISPTARVH